MYMPESGLIEQIVSPAEKQVFSLLPAFVQASGTERETLAAHMADLMGNPGEFSRFISPRGESSREMEQKLLRMFRENVELLVHKTWVENPEEKPKEKLLADLEDFSADFSRGAMQLAFLRFIAITRSVASLLFGSSGRAPDFLLYAFRIDPKFGLFFWYVGEMEKQGRTPPGTDDLLRLEILLGIFTLSCF